VLTDRNRANACTPAKGSENSGTSKVTVTGGTVLPNARSSQPHRKIGMPEAKAPRRTWLRIEPYARALLPAAHARHREGAKSKAAEARAYPRSKPFNILKYQSIYLDSVTLVC
jgi:hypothetical protein